MKKFNAYHLSWLAEELRNAGYIEVDEIKFYKWYNAINDGNHDKPQDEFYLFAAFDELMGICPNPIFSKIVSLVEDYPTVNWVDAFSRFQVRSKICAADTLLATEADFGDIWIMGGWVGVLPLLLMSKLPHDRYTSIVSYDLDDTANIAGEKLVDSPRYRAKMQDIYALDYSNFSGTIVNTICEHLSRFNHWQDGIPNNTLMLLQSNNMFGVVEDHVNCVNDLDDFIRHIHSKEIIHKETSTYNDQYERYTVLALR